MLQHFKVCLTALNASLTLQTRKSCYFPYRKEVVSWIPTGKLPQKSSASALEILLLLFFEGGGGSGNGAL